MKRVLIPLLGLLILAAPAWAVWYAGNALAVGDASAEVTFSSAQCNGGVCSSISIVNTGANVVYVKVYDQNEGTVAVITTASAGAVLIPAGKGYSVTHNKATERDRGYIGFARIGPGGGLTTTLNVVAK